MIFFLILKFNNIFQGSHSCYVWCHKRGGGYMTQGWRLPDGTPCGSHYQFNSPFKSHFCVNGECRSFDCDGVSEDNLSHCPSTSVLPKPKEKPDFTWTSMSPCFQSCFNNSAGVRLVAKECVTE